MADGFVTVAHGGLLVWVAVIALVLMAAAQWVQVWRTLEKRRERHEFEMYRAAMKGLEENGSVDRDNAPGAVAGLWNQPLAAHQSGGAGNGRLDTLLESGHPGLG